MKRDRNRLISWAMTIVAAAVAVPWLWHKYETRPPWWDPVQHYILHVGLPVTAKIAALSVVGATAIGIVLGTLLTIDFWPSRALIRGYVEVWRGLPIIVTMFLIYFALPRLDETIPHLPDINPLAAWQAATVGLILWGSAQVAEATRGAVQSIPREQHEAAAALGFGWTGRHAFVVLPQAARRLLPPLISLVANLIQNTTIAALIAANEVLDTADRSREQLLFTRGDAYASLPIYVGVLAIFFAISFPLTRLAAFLEKRLA